MSTDLINLSVTRRKPLKDQVTPYKLALLLLIDEHCKMATQVKKGITSLWYSDEEELLFLTTLLNLVQSPDVDLKTFRKLLDGIVKPAIIESVTERLRCLYDDGVNAVMTLIQTLPSNVFISLDSSSVSAMSKNSVCGLFIRRQCLAFDKLSFSQVTQLYHKFRVVYRNMMSARSQSGSEHIEFCGSARRDSTSMIEASDGDVSLGLGNFIDDRIDTEPPRLNTDSSHYSQQQAEYFIAQQTFLLSHNELEALSPRELQSRISDLLQSNPDMAEAHYLSYLNSLRLREYCGTLDSLHVYYDHCPGLSSHSSNVASAGVKNKSDDDTLTRAYRYAVLGLAATQFRFGHRKEALLAVQEAIRIAQEANDSACLQHALGWLQRLGIQIEGGQGFLLDKLITSAGELNLPYLTSLGIQAFVRHCALSAVSPASVFENLLRSEVLNYQHFLMDMVPVSLSQKAALWEMYGRSEMSLIAAQLVLSLNTQESGVYHNTESECAALCCIARHHADQGLFDLAYDVIHSARDRFPLSTNESKLWMACEQNINFTVALNSSCHSSAEQAISCLASIDRLEAAYCKCCLLADKSEASQLIENVDSVISDCRRHESSQQHFNQLVIKLLLLKANMLCSTNNGSRAIQPLLDALCIAKQNHYMLLSALTSVHLAYVQYHLGSPQLALDHLAQVYTIVMTHASLFDRARMLYLDVKCRLAVAVKEQCVERTRVLTSCVEKMQQVVTWYRKLGCNQRLKDACYFQSRLYHQLGLSLQRNKCAHEFHHLDMQFPTVSVAMTCQL